MQRKSPTIQERRVTREQVAAAIVECAEKLGRAPTIRELEKVITVSRWKIKRLFGSYTRALADSNLEGKPSGRRVEMQALFQDWARVVREMKRIPSSCEYAYFGKYSEGPLSARFGGWAKVAPGLKRYVEEQGKAEEWKDVLEMIDGQEPALRAGGRGMSYARARAAGKDDAAARTTKEAKILPDRPLYGAPMLPYPLAHCPINEAGVLFLFGAMAADLGFMVTHLQSEFPDGEAMRLVEGNRCQRVKFEVEWQSHNFVKHDHDVSGADVIVCWEHNWPDCPLEVVELRKAVSNQPKQKTFEIRRNGGSGGKSDH